ncbi:PLDc_N domain-containing protein [Paenibacillus spiritus]|uniref:PLDc_N domain-containing protein n=1 Tax=Paenibacillus spiritus TaxID=2496557 RepID=A0A5J5FSV9_9BACL|nr:PLD nuclease N-terminal domain-containing protein [Paenibacillus spiritus]KAA8996234.1 PLDc_N domain-containing protein [Paenibacillus spiritus]
METFQEYWPFLVPLIVLELVLALTALTHVLRHPRYRFGSRAVWIPVVLLLQIIGPVVYFVFGRGEEE